MTHIKMTVDDEQIMDEDVTQWQAQPPLGLQTLLSKSGGKMVAWSQSAQNAFLEALIAKRDTHIEVHTFPQGWNVRCTHAAQDKPRKKPKRGGK